MSDSNNETNEFDESYANQIDSIIDTLELDSETDRKILKSRFLAEVLKYEKRKEHTKKYYNVFRFIVTIGSILLPAILSIGQMDPAKLPRNFDQITYWSSWTISLMVTASNGFLQLFSLDKNYFEYALTTEQLKTEGWQYFQLAGKYEDDETHQEAYKPFCKSIENIKRKQVEKEFSGKGDVNKNKKDKKFNFQEELMKNLPDHLKDEIENKKKENEKSDKPEKMMNEMTSKLDQIDTLMTLFKKNNDKSEKEKEKDKDIEKGKSKDISIEVGSELISNSIDKIIKGSE